MHIKDLTEEDIGKRVVYTPKYGPIEDGTITGYNDLFVFVRYRGGNHSKATSPEDLEYMK